MLRVSPAFAFWSKAANSGIVVAEARVVMTARSARIREGLFMSSGGRFGIALGAKPFSHHAAAQVKRDDS
jgi:hypothetical protein